MATKKASWLNPTGAQKSPDITMADLGAMPILRNPDAEKQIVDYVMNRVNLADIERKERAAACQAIDMQLFAQPSGIDDDERKMKLDLEAGRSVRPIQRNYGFGVAQLEEANTYLMSLYAPEMDIFTCQATADIQDKGNAVVARINRDGKHAGYYRNMSLFVTSALRYNFGVMGCWWEQHSGFTFKKASPGVVNQEWGKVWEGNYLNSFDVYNFFYDTSKLPVDLPKKGEYFGWFEPITGFNAQRLQDQGKLFGIGRYINADTGVVKENRVSQYYIKPPKSREVPADTRQPDFTADLTGGAMSSASASVPGLEVTHFIAWINPRIFGNYIPKGSKAGQLELWYFKIVNGKYLGFMEQLKNTHGMLPCVISTPAEDTTGSGQQSYAEILIPLQQFISFLLNSHVQATRKALGGVWFYDPTRIPLGDLPEGDMTGHKVAVNPGVSGQGIDSAVKQFTDAPETAQHLNQIGSILELMQKILPTDMLRQVADLQRATQYQAAATVQAGNRRHLKLARVIYDQAFNLLVIMMVYNLYANLTQFSYLDAKTKKRQEVSVADLVDLDLEYAIGTGIKGIDRLQIVEVLREAINYVVQSSQGNTRVDILGLISYWTELAGDKTDLNQFVLAPEIQAQLAMLQNTKVAPAAPAPAPAAPGQAATL